jgi:hypothetical protein
MEVAGCGAVLCCSLVQPGDDPSPVAFLNARDNPFVIGWRCHGGEVLLRQLSRLADI